MSLAHSVTLAMFFALVASPKWFFKNLLKILNLKNDDYDVDSPFLTGVINPATIIPTYESLEMIEQSEKILNNLNTMVKNAKNRRVKQLWKIKRAEYIRILRWNRIANV